jgi:hypothetical protein
MLRIDIESQFEDQDPDGIDAVRHVQADDMADLFGGQAEDYRPLLANAPSWRIMPHLIDARKQGHNPVAYAMRKMGIAA